VLAPITRKTITQATLRLATAYQDAGGPPRRSRCLSGPLSGRQRILRSITPSIHTGTEELADRSGSGPGFADAIPPPESPLAARRASPSEPVSAGQIRSGLLPPASRRSGKRVLRPASADLRPRSGHAAGFLSGVALPPCQADPFHPPAGRRNLHV